jgi:hypothetical protein
LTEELAGTEDLEQDAAAAPVNDPSALGGLSAATEDLGDLCVARED